MKLTITTLVIVEEGQVQNIYHSLEDNQEKAYQEINNIFNTDVVKLFANLKGMKFDSINSDENNQIAENYYSRQRWGAN